MSIKEQDFQLDVIDRLARIETKMDAQNGVVKQAVIDIRNLKEKATMHDAQWKLLKKIGAGIITCLSVFIGLLGKVKGWF
jgi:hypothetical protein